MKMVISFAMVTLLIRNTGSFYFTNPLQWYRSKEELKAMSTLLNRWKAAQPESADKKLSIPKSKIPTELIVAKAPANVYNKFYVCMSGYCPYHF